MAINLINTAKSYLTDAVISRVSNTLGESPEGVQKALVGALPVVLGSLVARSSTPEGPSFLGTLLRPFIANTLTPSASAVVADDPEVMMQRGSSIVDTLFGPGSKLVAGALAQYAGIKIASATGLLGMAGTLITNTVSQQMLAPNGNVDVSSLMDLVAEQKNTVREALPAGLAALLGNVPGLDALSGLTTGIKGGLTNLKGAVGSTLAGAGAAQTDDEVRGDEAEQRVNEVPKTSVPPPTNTPAYSSAKRSGGTKFIPFLGMMVAAAVLFFALRGCGNGSSNSTDTSTLINNDTTSAAVPDATLTDTVAAVREAVTDTISSAATSNDLAALGAFGERKLPDGVALNLPQNGIENKLLSFIEDDSKTVDKETWFNFDRLLYETASARLRPESREQLQNIAAILKAYPAVNLKIGGYTDNTGKAAANKKLSQERAESAMKELVNLGVAPTRLEAEGYGSEHPVASNATEAGRAQNRRTACRVTKK